MKLSWCLQNFNVVWCKKNGVTVKYFFLKVCILDEKSLVGWFHGEGWGVCLLGLSASGGAQPWVTASQVYSMRTDPRTSNEKFKLIPMYFISDLGHLWLYVWLVSFPSLAGAWGVSNHQLCDRAPFAPCAPMSETCLNHLQGSFVYMHPANERQRYIVKSSFIVLGAYKKWSLHLFFARGSPALNHT